MTFLIFLIIVLLVIAEISYSWKRTVRVAKEVSKRTKATVSSDGCVVPQEEDETCEGKDGHTHKELVGYENEKFGKRYVVHNEIENGYVVLNGVRKKIKDCKDD